MFIHVSAAWVSMFVYAPVAGTSAVALIWPYPLADVAAAEAAPLGAAFTLICLVGPDHHISMLVPLFAMVTSFTLFFVKMLFVRMRAAIIGGKLRALRQIQ